MKESDVRQQFAKALRARGLYVRCIENAVGPITLDVHYFGAFSGIAEIKYIPKWPRRTTTPVRVPHRDRVLKQAAAMIECRLAGGRANLIARIERSWLVFNAGGAFLWAKYPDLWTGERLCDLASLVIVPADDGTSITARGIWDEIVDELRRT